MKLSSGRFRLISQRLLCKKNWWLKFSQQLKNTLWFCQTKKFKQRLMNGSQENWAKNFAIRIQSVTRWSMNFAGLFMPNFVKNLARKITKNFMMNTTKLSPWRFIKMLGGELLKSNCVQMVVGLMRCVRSVQKSASCLELTVQAFSRAA